MGAPPPYLLGQWLEHLCALSAPMCLGGGFCRHPCLRMRKLELRSVKGIWVKIYSAFLDANAGLLGTRL